MTKYAFLVGITYHNRPKSEQLVGTFTDIITMRNFLIDTYKYNSDNIVFLTDEYLRYIEAGSLTGYPRYNSDRQSINIQGTDVYYPTKTNILYVISQTIKKLNKDDELLVHICGHGKQSFYNSSNREETDRRDEMYKAVDNYGQYVNFYDHELKALFNDVPCKTRVICDCCHSATIMDAPNVMYYDINTERLVKRRENDDTTFNKNVLVMSGARDSDYSYDGTNFRSLQRMGVYTYSLLEASRKILNESDVVDIDKLLIESTLWLAKFHKSNTVHRPSISGSFETIEEINNKFAFNRNSSKDLSNTQKRHSSTNTDTYKDENKDENKDTHRETEQDVNTDKKPKKNEPIIKLLKKLLELTN